MCGSSFPQTACTVDDPGSMLGLGVSLDNATFSTAASFGCIHQLFVRFPAFSVDAGKTRRVENLVPPARDVAFVKPVSIQRSGSVQLRGIWKSHTA